MDTVDSWDLLLRAAPALGDKLNGLFGEASEAETNENRQVICLLEEAGEFAAAFRRFTGQARRSGEHKEMAEELADVFIAGAVAAAMLEIDLDAEIAKKMAKNEARGWRENPSA